MIGIVCAFFHTEGKGFYSKPIDTIERISEYLYLTEKFWHKKAVGYQEKGLIFQS